MKSLIVITFRTLLLASIAAGLAADGELETFVPRVIGSTNPIWLDADGDGRFQSAFDDAQGIVEQHRTDPEKLLETLPRYDAAVAVQVESLMSPASN